MDAVPTARTYDPSTSHEAGEAHRTSGRRALEQERVQDALERYGQGGVTSDELAHAAGLDRYMVARRLPELRDAIPARAYVAGYRLAPEKRRSVLSGRKGMVWRPAIEADGQQALGV